jgi:hypothetical protein
MDSFFAVLDVAHQSLADGSIDDLYTRRDEYGYRSIIVHSDQGWNVWFNEADET